MPRTPRWQWALLAMLVLALYAPTLRNDFVRWDDLDHVIQNQRVVGADGLRRSWVETESPGFYPILYTTFFLEWRAAGGKPWLFHLDNVLLHALSALLVLQLCRRLGLDAVTAWFVAAVWALHPLQVASVAWIAERKNVLYVFFWLASLLLYLRAASRPPRSLARWVAATGSVLAFALALLSKGAALTLPAAIVLVEWARGRRLDRRFWLSVTPHALVALGAGLGLLSSVPIEARTPALVTRLTHVPHALWFYVRTFLWPDELLPIYPSWPLDPPAAADVLAWLLLAALAAAVLGLLSRLPRVVLLGVGLFLTNVVLVVGIVWFTFLGHSPVGDHLAYLPNLGLALVFVGGVGTLAQRMRLPAPALAAGMALWCGTLALATWRQIPIWRDTETLWQYNLARYPDCALCHYNLAVFYDDVGKLEPAGEHFEAALRLEPSTEAAMNLGNVRFIQGHGEEAERLYRQAIALDANNSTAHHNLGVLLTRMGKYEEAAHHHRQAVRLSPTYIPAQRGLGEALWWFGDVAGAKAAFEAATQLVPGDPDSERGLARIAVWNGDREAGVAHYEQALRGQNAPGVEVRLRYELAQVLVDLERRDEAIAHYQAAFRLEPDNVDVVMGLATTLVADGNFGEAVRVLSDALARQPEAARVAGYLAWVRATAPDPKWRDSIQAVRLAEHACALTDYANPDHLDTLAAAYAEAGRFDDAVQTAHRALEAAEPDSSLAEALRARLALYEQRLPYRES